MTVPNRTRLVVVALLAACGSPRETAPPTAPAAPHVALAPAAPAAAAPAPEPAPAPAPAPAPRTPPKAAYTPAITADEVLTRIAHLADDALEGRESGTEGGRATEEWVASEFRRMGLEPLSAEKGSPFTRVPLSGKSVPEATWIEVAGAGAEAQRIGAELGARAFSFSKAGDAGGGLVFAGFGITAPDQGYDDYAGLDVKGKVVLVLRHGPGEGVAGSPWQNPMRRAAEVAFSAKAKRAADAGAAAILLVNDLKHPDEPLPVEATGEAAAIPVFAIKRPTADLLLAPTGKTLAQFQSAIDADRKPQSAAVPGITVRAHVTMNETAARNVVFVRRGSDPSLAAEAVLVCAHMDHVGRGTFGADPRGAGQIHNGADDNASGTAALLEVAESLAAGPATKRSVVFAAWCAEEKGLIGSEHFAANPLWDLAKVAVVLNMDMVGRYRDASEKDEGLIVEGTGTAVGTLDAVRRLAAAANLRCTTDTWEAWDQSDHASFYKRDVPSLFVHTGVHAEYHRPTDDWWLVAAEPEARIARMVAALTVECADAAARPAFAKKPPRPAIGVRLADAETGSGARLLLVVPGMGANAAGLAQGDVIVSYRGKPVASAADLSKLIQESKPGDVVEVVFRRGAETKTVKVAVSGL